MRKTHRPEPDAIPADSEAGRAALAQGGEAAKKVEIPCVATSASPSAEVGRFFETQSSKGGRYTVTLPDGTKVEELNKATAAMMVPFDSVKFTGNYGNMTEISYQSPNARRRKALSIIILRVSGRSAVITSPSAPTSINKARVAIRLSRRMAAYLPYQAYTIVQRQA